MTKVKMVPADVFDNPVGIKAETPLTVDERIELTRLSVKNVVSHRDRNGAPLTDMVLYLDNQKICAIESKLYGEEASVYFEKGGREKMAAFVDAGNWTKRIAELLYGSEHMNDASLESTVSTLANAPLAVKEDAKFRRSMVKKTKSGFFMGKANGDVHSIVFKHPMTDVMGANGGKKAIREALLNLLENYESGFELFNSKEQLIELELDDLFGTHPALPEKKAA